MGKGSWAKLHLPNLFSEEEVQETHNTFNIHVGKEVLGYTAVLYEEQVTQWEESYLESESG